MSNINSKRIAKNTILLYIRMLLTMGVSLYTSRVVLNTLGVDDFGIYNVVGGVVMMFAFLNTSMTSATQRFLSFELGKGDTSQTKKTFSMSLNIHIIIAISIFILAETIGLWFLNAKLVIPNERMEAANWVYQFSIFSFMISVVGIPYNALIIAFERMNIYAYMSIVEVFLKLMIVFMITWIDYDKLKLYAVLILCVTLFMFAMYKIYCNKKYFESNYTFSWDKPLYLTLMSYAGWNLFGNISGVAMTQGVNILLNIFFGPTVNAARGIAFQIKSAVSGFVGNFQIAINPQIIKSYSAGNIEYMHELIFQGAKYSYFLLLMIVLPILLETELILKLWLKMVPDYTISFTRLILVNILIDCISGPLMTAAQASGRIKIYQGVVGTLILLNLPISFLFLKFGMPPEVTLYISISISLVALIARLYIISPLVSLSISGYLFKVILRILPVTFLSIIPPISIHLFLNQGIMRMLIVVFFSTFSVLVSIYWLGLRKSEQAFMKNKIRQILIKNSILK